MIYLNMQGFAKASGSAVSCLFQEDIIISQGRCWAGVGGDACGNIQIGNPRLRCPDPFKRCGHRAPADEDFAWQTNKETTAFSKIHRGRSSMQPVVTQPPLINKSFQCAKLRERQERPVSVGKKR